MGSNRLFQPRIIDDVPEITSEELFNQLGKVSLIDVRRLDEFNGELAHIEGARLVTLGPELDSYLQNLDRNLEIVFVCRSGARSGRATLQAQALGFLKSVNLGGGMLLWNEKKLPVTRTT